MTAFMYVTEYVGLATRQIAGSVAQVPQEPPLVEQAIAISATSAQSAAFNANTTLVRVHIDGSGPAGVTFGLNPTATVESGGLGSGRFAANQTEYRSVTRGLGMKVAGIVTT
jgi:hypothetical protein